MELSGEQFESIVNGLLAHRQPSEGRRAPRLNIRADVEIIVHPDKAKPETWRIQLQDVSRGGVGFAHHTALSKADLFALRLPTNTGTHMTVLCVVRHCHQITANFFG